MKAETFHVDSRHQSLSVASESLVDPLRVDSTDIGQPSSEDTDLARAADHILDDCLFAMGQVVGTRPALGLQLQHDRQQPVRPVHLPRPSRHAARPRVQVYHTAAPRRIRGGWRTPGGGERPGG